MRLAGAALLIIVLVISIGGWIAFLIHLPSMISVIGGTLALMMLTSDRTAWAAFLKFLTLQSRTLSDGDRENLAALLQTGSRAALGFGVFMNLLSLALILSHMADPSSLGPAMSVAMLPLFYGVILSEIILVPMHANLMRGISPGKGRSVPKTGLALVLFAALFSITAVLTLSLNMSSPDQARVRAVLGDLVGSDAPPPPSEMAHEISLPEQEQ